MENIIFVVSIIGWMSEVSHKRSSSSEVPLSLRSLHAWKWIYLVVQDWLHPTLCRNFRFPQKLKYSLSFKLDNFWPSESFQHTQPGSDPALTKANGSFAINFIGEGKNLSQTVPIWADYFAQIKVLVFCFFVVVLVFFFLIAMVSIIIYIFSLLFDWTSVCCALYKQERKLAPKSL